MIISSNIRTPPNLLVGKIGVIVLCKVGPFEDLLSTVKKKIFGCCEHVSRPFGITKTKLQGTGSEARRLVDRRKDGNSSKLFSISKSSRGHGEKEGDCHDGV